MTKEELKKEAQEQVNCCTPLYPECFIQGYLAGAEPRENKIADIKANCDLAIEGRDIKIKELELELTVEKDQHQEETNLHLHAEDYIKELEQQIEKMKCCYNCSKWYDGECEESPKSKTFFCADFRCDKWEFAND